MHFRVNVLKFVQRGTYYIFSVQLWTCKVKREIMKQTLGSILSIGGLIGVIFFGYKYLDDSESFSFLGADIAVSTGDYVPILISLIILIAGVLIYRSDSH